jgi:hypothetical protein
VTVYVCLCVHIDNICFYCYLLDHCCCGILHWQPASPPFPPAHDDNVSFFRIILAFFVLSSSSLLCLLIQKRKVLCRLLTLNPFFSYSIIRLQCTYQGFTANYTFLSLSPFLLIRLPRSHIEQQG